MPNPHRLKKLIIRRFISLTLLFSFLFQQINLPAACADSKKIRPAILLNPHEILSRLSLPSELGSLEEIHSGQHNRLVILVQDAHAIADAQKNIRKIIEHFQSEYGLKLIGLEGASGPLDATLFRAFPDSKILSSVFQKYLELGELSGGAAAAVLNPGEADYYGIENPSLYEECIDAFLESLAGEARFSENLESLDQKLSELKTKYYSPALLKLDRRLEDLEKRKIDLVEFLFAFAGNGRSPLHSRFPQISALLSEAQKAPVRSKEKLRHEIRPLIGQIRNKIRTRSEQKEFHGKLQEYATEQISAERFAAFLVKRAETYQVPVSLSAESETQISRRALLMQMKGGDFFREFHQFISEIKEGLFQNRKQRALDLAARRLALLHKLNQKTLAYEEWDELLSQAGPPRASESFKTGKEIEKILRNFQKEFQPAARFYEISQRRDAAFLKALTELMNQKRRSVSLLVAGGFHTHGLTALLKEKGISYVLISPAIQNLPEKIPYLDFMQGKVSWRDYFKVENGKIDLYEAFARAAGDRLLGQAEAGRRKAEGKSFQNDSFGPRPSAFHLLKSWRDQIIRTLAAAGNLEKAGQYTRFLDRAAAPDSRRAFYPQQKEWLEKVGRFVEGLRDLKNQNRLTAENIISLSRPRSGLLHSQGAQFPAAAGGLVQRFPVPAGWFFGFSKPRSEVRAITPTGLEEQLTNPALLSADIRKGFFEKDRNGLQYGFEAMAKGLNTALRNHEYSIHSQNTEERKKGLVRFFETLLYHLNKDFFSEDRDIYKFLATAIAGVIDREILDKIRDPNGRLPFAERQILPVSPERARQFVQRFNEIYYILDWERRPKHWLNQILKDLQPGAFLPFALNFDDYPSDRIQAWARALYKEFGEDALPFLQIKTAPPLSDLVFSPEGEAALILGDSKTGKSSLSVAMQGQGFKLSGESDSGYFMLEIPGYLLAGSMNELTQVRARAWKTDVVGDAEKRFIRLKRTLPQIGIVRTVITLDHARALTRGKNNQKEKILTHGNAFTTSITFRENLNFLPALQSQSHLDYPLEVIEMRHRITDESGYKKAARRLWDTIRALRDQERSGSGFDGAFNLEAHPSARSEARGEETPANGEAVFPRVDAEFIRKVMGQSVEPEQLAAALNQRLREFFEPLRAQIVRRSPDSQIPRSYTGTLERKIPPRTESFWERVGGKSFKFQLRISDMPRQIENATLPEENRIELSYVPDEDSYFITEWTDGHLNGRPVLLDVSVKEKRPEIARPSRSEARANHTNAEQETAKKIRNFAGHLRNDDQSRLLVIAETFEEMGGIREDQTGLEKFESLAEKLTALSPVLLWMESSSDRDRLSFWPELITTVHGLIRSLLARLHAYTLSRAKKQDVLEAQGYLNLYEQLLDRNEYIQTSGISRGQLGFRLGLMNKTALAWMMHFRDTHNPEDSNRALRLTLRAAEFLPQAADQIQWTLPNFRILGAELGQVGRFGEALGVLRAGAEIALRYFEEENVEEQIKKFIFRGYLPLIHLLDKAGSIQNSALSAGAIADAAALFKEVESRHSGPLPAFSADDIENFGGTLVDIARSLREQIREQANQEILDTRQGYFKFYEEILGNPYVSQPGKELPYQIGLANKLTLAWITRFRKSRDEADAERALEFMTRAGELLPQIPAQASWVLTNHLALADALAKNGNPDRGFKILQAGLEILWKYIQEKDVEGEAMIRLPLVYHSLLKAYAADPSKRQAVLQSVGFVHENAEFILSSERKRALEAKHKRLLLSQGKSPLKGALPARARSRPRSELRKVHAVARGVLDSLKNDWELPRALARDISDTGSSSRFPRLIFAINRQAEDPKYFAPDELAFRLRHPDYSGSLDAAVRDGIEQTARVTEDYLKTHPNAELNFAFAFPVVKSNPQVQEWILEYIEAIRNLKEKMKEKYPQAKIEGNIRILMAQTEKELLPEFVRRVEASGVAKIILTDSPRAVGELEKYLRENAALVYGLGESGFPVVARDKEFESRIVVSEPALETVFPFAVDISNWLARDGIEITAETLLKIPEILPAGVAAFNGTSLSITMKALEAIAQRYRIESYTKQMA